MVQIHHLLRVAYLHCTSVSHLHHHFHGSSLLFLVGAVAAILTITTCWSGRVIDRRDCGIRVAAVAAIATCRSRRVIDRRDWGTGVAAVITIAASWGWVIA